MDINQYELNPSISEKIYPFFKEILSAEPNIHSIYIVGSAITPDFNEKTSDINSVIILHKLNFDFLKLLSNLGNKYSKKKIAAPLLMTLDYIHESLDVFPVEFHEFRLIHKTIYGDDILSDLKIEKRYLRLQCEREIKARLIGLRQGYISSLSKKENITDVISAFIVGYIPVLRAIIYLLDMTPPVKRSDVIEVFGKLSSIKTDPLIHALKLRSQALKLSSEEVNEIFESLYLMVEETGRFVNEILS